MKNQQNEDKHTQKNQKQNICNTNNEQNSIRCKHVKNGYKSEKGKLPNPKMYKR